MIDTGVYLIRNLVNQKVYIGSSSISLVDRMEGHKYCLRNKVHRNRHLQNAWDRYGKDNFEFSILKRCIGADRCLFWEQKYITKFDSFNRAKGYNRAPVAGTVKGLKWTKKSKKKLSETVKSWWRNATPEQLKNFSEKQSARVFSEKTRKKMSQAMVGFRHTEETRKRMCVVQKEIAKHRDRELVSNTLKDAWKRRKLKGKTQKEIDGHKRTADKLRGIPRTDEVKKKLSIALRGRPVPMERRLRIASTLRGRKLSQTHKDVIKKGSSR